MPTSTQPYDGNFVNFGTGGTPGSSDFDRIQNDIDFISSGVFTMLSRSITTSWNSTLTPADMSWDTTVQSNSVPVSQMVVYAGSPTALATKIVAPYVGDWQVKAHVRCQFNDNSGSTQIFLYKTFTSGHADILLDEDESPCVSTGAVHLRINCDTQIVAGDIPLGAGFKIQFVQNSGGLATVTSDLTPYYAWPRFSARWIGTSQT